LTCFFSPFTIHHSSPKPPAPEIPKKIPLESMTASQLIEFIKEKEKDVTLIDAKEQKIRKENAGFRKEIEEYLKFV